MHLVIHAGPPKTASTTLQVALAANRDALAAAGIDYMEVADPYQWSLVALYRAPDAPIPQELAMRFGTRDAVLDWSAGAWEDFEAKIDRSIADVVPISSEFFSTEKDKEAMIPRLGQRAERVSFIAHARAPVELHASGIYGPAATRRSPRVE